MLFEEAKEETYMKILPNTAAADPAARSSRKYLPVWGFGVGHQHNILQRLLGFSKTPLNSYMDEPENYIYLKLANTKR